MKIYSEIKTLENKIQNTEARVDRAIRMLENSLSQLKNSRNGKKTRSPRSNAFRN